MEVHFPLGPLLVPVLHGLEDGPVRDLRLSDVVRQHEKADTHVRDHAVDQMHRRRQHHVVARCRQRRVELHIRHVIVGILLQPFHGSADGLQILLCGPLAGKAGNGHLVYPAKFHAVPQRVLLVREAHEGHRLAEIAGVLHNHLAIAPVFKIPK